MLKMLKRTVTTSTYCHRAFLHVFTRCKRGPLHIKHYISLCLQIIVTFFKFWCSILVRTIWTIDTQDFLILSVWKNNYCYVIFNGYNWNVSYNLSWTAYVSRHCHNLLAIRTYHGFCSRGPWNVYYLFVLLNFKKQPSFLSKLHAAIQSRFYGTFLWPKLSVYT